MVVNTFRTGSVCMPLQRRNSTRRAPKLTSEFDTFEFVKLKPPEFDAVSVGLPGFFLRKRGISDRRARRPV